MASALALRQQFSVQGDMLERVKVFKYLGCLMSQDDDDIQAICTQMQKARATWAHIGQVLWSENVLPFCRRQVLPDNNTNHPPLWQ